jgi:hypothetical protein
MRQMLIVSTVSRVAPRGMLDPRLSEPPFEGMTVTIRWKDVTARESLVALLDNYGLVLLESQSRNLGCKP